MKSVPVAFLARNGTGTVFEQNSRKAVNWMAASWNAQITIIKIRERKPVWWLECDDFALTVIIFVMHATYLLYLSSCNVGPNFPSSFPSTRDSPSGSLSLFLFLCSPSFNGSRNFCWQNTVKNTPRLIPHYLLYSCRGGSIHIMPSPFIS